MDVLAILEELENVLVEGDEEVEGEDAQPKREKREEIKDKLESLSSLVEIVGPVARKEAIVANAFRLVKSAWKWIIVQEEVEGTAAEFTGEARTDRNVSLLRVREALLRVINALTPGLSEVVDIEVVAELILTFMKLAQEDEVRSGDSPRISDSMKFESLKAIKNVCLRSERNRDFLTHLNLDSNAKKLEPQPEEDEQDSFPAFFCAVVKVPKPFAQLVGYWCEALVAFVINDDRRVTPNRSEDRKRLITTHGGLPALVGFLSKFTEAQYLNKIVVAVTLMASTKQQCDLILEAGAFKQGSGLELALHNYTTVERERLVLNVIYCIKALCLSPNFQQILEKSFVVKNIVASARRMKTKPTHLEVIFSALATITIQSPIAVAQFLKVDGLETVFDAVNSYQDNSALAKSFCLILENVVAHGGDAGNNILIDSTRESFLKQLVVAHPELVDTFLKPTLRGLGLYQQRQ